MRTLAVSALLVLGAASCKDNPNKREPATAQAPTAQAPAAQLDDKPDPPKDEYVADVMAFTNQTRQQVLDRMKLGSAPLAKEWNEWEAKGPMTEDRIRAFYKQTTNYIYELGEWHFTDQMKRASDARLVEDIKKVNPKNVLDFGGGTGIMAILLSRAGFDVTLADLDSTTLEFAAFRAKRHGDKLKIWKSDVEPAPPDAKYDLILTLDVMEHLPRNELAAVVDKLVKVKHAKTLVVMSAPFGKTAVHPMHLDADDHTKKQIERLRDSHTP